MPLFRLAFLLAIFGVLPFTGMTDRLSLASQQTTMQATSQQDCSQSSAHCCGVSGAVKNVNQPCAMTHGCDMGQDCQNYNPWMPALVLPDLPLPAPALHNAYLLDFRPSIDLVSVWRPPTFV